MSSLSNPLLLQPRHSTALLLQAKKRQETKLPFWGVPKRQESCPVGIFDFFLHPTPLSSCRNSQCNLWSPSLRKRKSAWHSLSNLFGLFARQRVQLLSTFSARFRNCGSFFRYRVNHTYPQPKFGRCGLFKRVLQKPVWYAEQ